MTEIYIVRHAEAEGNLYRRIQGQHDSMVTLNGYKQIEALQRRFEPIKIDAAYASDLIRTCETAKAICVPKKLELHRCPELREMYLGSWENTPFGELERNFPHQLSIFNKSPFEFFVEGSEPFGDVSARMEKKLRQIAAEHEGETVAVFSHGCAIRALLYALFGSGDGCVDSAGHCDNTGVSHLYYDNGSFKIDYLNDNSHLSESISTLARQNWWRTGDDSLDHNMWYEPLPELENERYVQYRRDAWQLVYGSLKGFDGSDFLLDARRTTAADPNALVLCRLGNGIAGLLQLNPDAQKDKGVGYIPFLYLCEKYRDKGLGVQLIGYAVNYFRNLGRSCLRLRVAPSNERAVHFYEKYGFRLIGKDNDFLGGTYIMEMPI